MCLFEIIIQCITALGALATAGTFFYVIKGQKGTQRQIDSLAEMATTFARQYEMARIQAGPALYPQIEVKVLSDKTRGMKIQVKNNSFPVEIYRMIIKSVPYRLDTAIQPGITLKKGETKLILPKEEVPNSVCRLGANIRLFMTTPFKEAYEVSCTTMGGLPQISPIAYCEAEQKKRG